MKYCLSKKYRSLLAFALALSVLFSLNVASFAEGKMQWKFPGSDDDMVYAWEFEKQVQEVVFNDIAMYIEFDVEDSGKQHVFSAGWLPEIPAEEQETASAFNTSFYHDLQGEAEYIEEADIYAADVNELIKSSGVSMDEAQNQWFTNMSLHTEHTYPYKIEIFDNFILHGRDIIIGAYGGKALNVEEDSINGYEAVKAAIDCTDVYNRDNFTEEEWENVKKSVFRNYIFLFEPESEYLICVCGTLDMDTLEKVAANLTVHETELERTSYNMGVNYLLCDLAKG